jgi:hypothetical protein
MDILKLFTDPYDRKARLYPALLLFFPAILTALVLSQPMLPFLQQLILIIASCGFLFLLTQFVRDSGKKREIELFEEWGGIPSVTIFRYRDNKLDSITKARYHLRLSAMCQTSLPTLEDEQSNQSMADAIYTTWSNYLRAQTRDNVKFHLLFRENINYGFRRNVWGIRYYGIMLNIVCLVINIILCVCINHTNCELLFYRSISTFFSLFFLTMWIKFFTKNWVRVPADAYAARLAETVDVLFSSSPNP